MLALICNEGNSLGKNVDKFAWSDVSYFCEHLYLGTVILKKT